MSVYSLVFLTLNIGLIYYWLHLKALQLYEDQKEVPIEDYWEEQAKKLEIEDSLPHVFGKVDPYEELQFAIEKLEHYLIERMFAGRGGRRSGAYYDGTRVRSMSPEERDNLLRSDRSMATSGGMIVGDSPLHPTVFRGEYISKPPDLHKLITNLAVNPKTKRMQQMLGYDQPDCEN